MLYLKYLKMDMNLANNQQSRSVLRRDESKTAIGMHPRYLWQVISILRPRRLRFNEDRKKLYAT